MLIYNYQKEFLGIDEKELKTLGFNSLAELQKEVTDFADLFVKTPGHIHNFQHVHWIDFINYADISEESKVLINVNAKTFKATLSISPLFLIDNPAAPAYGIHLNNLRLLTKDENENIANDILKQEHPKVEPQEAKTFTPLQEIPSTQEPSSPEITTPIIEEPIIEDMYDMPQPTTVDEKPLDVDAFSLDVFEEDEKPEMPQTPAQPTPVTKEAVVEEWDNGYTYDPHIASEELGLPLDLIEEFIQDFIAQAKEFQSKIYTSIEEGDIENVKILSHKLKGVAANLRVEDAHEALATVSATSDMDVIQESIDTFYKIIAKLAGEPVQTAPNMQEDINKSDDDDTITLTLDNNNDKEEDDTISQKIDIPELSDDNFLETTDEPLSIEIKEEEEQESEESDKEEPVHFSKADIAREIGIDEESFNELFDDFIQESHEILTKVEASLKDDDLHTCHNEALKLKGMSDNMRIDQYKDELEILLDSNDKNAIQQAAEKINTFLNKISKTGV